MDKNYIDTFKNELAKMTHTQKKDIKTLKENNYYFFNIIIINKNNKQFFHQSFISRTIGCLSASLTINQSKNRIVHHVSVQYKVCFAD